MQRTRTILNNFGRGPPKDHLCEIISKLDQGFEEDLSFKSIVKAAYSVTLNIFRKNFFSFKIICKSRIKLSFHNKFVHYS